MPGRLSPSPTASCRLVPIGTPVGKADAAMRNIVLLMFAVAAGLTLSGIAANIYRMVAKKTVRCHRHLYPLRRDDTGRT